MADASPLRLTTELEPPGTSYISVGASVRLHVLCTNIDTQELVDPDALTLTETPPYQAPTDFVYGTDEELVRNSQGNYQIDLPITIPGTWKFRWLAENADDVNVGSNTTEIQGVEE